MMDPDPTRITYESLMVAYDFFNERLFGRHLPRCLITMQRKKRVYGYFSKGRFGTLEGEVTDEIALNPMHFRNRTTEQCLSTLVHEMTHLRQHHFGKPSRIGYHNSEWGDLMRAVGLIPSSTGAPGGKPTGQRVSHYIELDGAFAIACAELLRDGFTLRYADLFDDEEAKKKKAESKTKYTCPQCGLNAWAKPDAHIMCEACATRMDCEP
jgi:predicted SprT family Zn-dependent metalloprotease